MSKGIKNNPATGRAEQHPCRRLLTAAVTVAGPLCIIMPASAALNCTTQPSCTDLGYSKTSEANCESYVLCPFDKSYKACVNYKTAEIDCSGYTLSSCPDGAVNCSACGNGTDVKYKIDSCRSGFYRMATGAPCRPNTSCTPRYTCKANACSGYTLSSCPDNATSCSICQKGFEIVYKVNGCKSGYQGDTCVANACDGYTLTYCPANANCSECQSGDTTKYKIDSCEDGYVLNGSSCTSTSRPPRPTPPPGVTSECCQEGYAYDCSSSGSGKVCSMDPIIGEGNASLCRKCAVTPVGPI